jgi:hypothetical protein
MRTVPALLLAAALSAALVGCVSNAPSFEADPSADLAALKRFGWHAVPREATHPLDSEILRKRVRSSIAGDLTARGFVFDQAAAEFHVRSHLIVEANAKPAPRLSIGLGTGSYGGSMGTAVSVGGTTEIGKAQDGLTLVIELRDARSDDLLWQGWREVKPAIGDPSRPDLDAAVRAILADFPLPAGATKNR